MDNSVSKRIRAVIDYHKMSDSKFAQTISVGQKVVSNMFLRGTEPSSKTISSVIENFPTISVEWLLTGEGEMLKSEAVSEQIKKGIPLIENMQANCGFVVGSADSAFLKDCVMIVLPDLVADFVIKASGHSMINRQDPTRTITDGALVACNHCSGKIIQWGDVYALATIDGVFIKKLMPCEDEDYILCESFNEDNPPFKLYKELIVDMAKVSKAFNTANF